MWDEMGIKARIERIRKLATHESSSDQFSEAASIAMSVVHDTVGGSHPLMRALEESTKADSWTRVLGSCRAVLAIYDDGALPNPRLRIAHEIEGNVLDIAQTQAQLAEIEKDSASKQLTLAIAAFLAGAALEDALRRLCDANGLTYDQQRTSIAKLQATLYQPSKQIEVISQSDSKQITAWGDSRNKADHGNFADITQTEVVVMIMGVRAFLDKYLP